MMHKFIVKLYSDEFEFNSISQAAVFLDTAIDHAADVDDIKYYRIEVMCYDSEQG